MSAAPEQWRLHLRPVPELGASVWNWAWMEGGRVASRREGEAVTVFAGQSLNGEEAGRQEAYFTRASYELRLARQDLDGLRRERDSAVEALAFECELWRDETKRLTSDLAATRKRAIDAEARAAAEYDRGAEMAETVRRLESELQQALARKEQ